VVHGGEGRCAKDNLRKTRKVKGKCPEGETPAQPRQAEKEKKTLWGGDRKCEPNEKGEPNNKPKTVGKKKAEKGTVTRNEKARWEETIAEVARTRLVPMVYEDTTAFREREMKQGR